MTSHMDYCNGNHDTTRVSCNTHTKQLEEIAIKLAALDCENWESLSYQEKEKYIKRAHKPRAVDKRFLAMREIIDYADPSGLVMLRRKTDIACKIRELKALGRTERWLNAIESWARVVERSRNSHTLRSDFLQFSIFAGHAA